MTNNLLKQKVDGSVKHRRAQGAKKKPQTPMIGVRAEGPRKTHVSFSAPRKVAKKTEMEKYAEQRMKRYGKA